MLISRHVAVSAAMAAGIGSYTGLVWAGVVCFVFGVGIDVDHIFEFVVQHGRREFSFRRVYRACRETAARSGRFKFQKLYLVFHMVEAALVMWGLAFYTKNTYIAAAAAGYSGHLLLDAAGNTVTPITYSVVWRAAHRFDADAFFREPKRR